MIKPIETNYKGYKFRSRTEARWAVFFDALGVSWEYEKEGYELEDGTWYLPDFWLPEVEMWAEVKPSEFTETQKMTCALLHKATGFECLMLDGVPGAKVYKTISWEPAGVYEDTDISYPEGYCEEPCILTAHHINEYEQRWYWNLEFENFDDTINAVTAARSARFEHGETPGG